MDRSFRWVRELIMMTSRTAHMMISELKRADRAETIIGLAHWMLAGATVAGIWLLK